MGLEQTTPPTESKICYICNNPLDNGKPHCDDPRCSEIHREVTHWKNGLQPSSEERYAIYGHDPTFNQALRP